MMNDQRRSLREQLKEYKDKPTQAQFNEVVYTTGFVRLIEACSPPSSDYTVQLDGEFTAEALDMIMYAMRNEPEWFKLDDQV